MYTHKVTILDWSWYSWYFCLYFIAWHIKTDVFFFSLTILHVFAQTVLFIISIDPFYILNHELELALYSPVGLSYTTRWCYGVRLDSVLNMFMYTCLCVHMCECVPRRSCQISVPVVSASLRCSERRLVSWSRFTCSHLQLASVEMTEEEAITGASNGKQMCNYENRGLHLARSLPQRHHCNPLCNPNPDTAN